MSIIEQFRSSRSRIIVTWVLALGLCVPLVVSHAQAQEIEEETDPPEIANGERLFLETRFAQFFKTFLDNGGDTNALLPSGDPSLDKTVNWQNLPEQFVDGPFAGLSMNCRSCHLVDEIGVEADGTINYGMRTYTDFARRSPIPQREDGKTVTARNSPPLVNAALPRSNFFLHFDAEFPTMVDLVKGTLTGRNYGWVPGELAEAIAHVARIIREDDGKGELAGEFGYLSYTTLLTGTDPNIPGDFVLPEEFRVDVVNASDQELFQAVARLIAAYTEDLVFSQDDDGNFNLSPYDAFLQTNGLPQQPRKWESDIAYSKRLLRKIEKLEYRGHLQFISQNPNTEDGAFEFHPTQAFVFGEQELRGLKIFFTSKSHRLQPGKLAQGGIGNCIACHAAPNFTDFKFHNTGIAQAEYDGIHGDGAFVRLDIPRLIRRNSHPNEYLPATEQHPHSREPYRAIPTPENPQLTDLGVWNIFLNPDYPKSQGRIWRTLCEEVLRDHFRPFSFIRFCRPNQLLSTAIARFKTPGLRDLEHSAPYTHTGQIDTLEDMIRSYIKNASLTRSGDLRNGDSRLSRIGLTDEDITPLVLFLKSLNEDYS
ncbi:MAG: hypothetical protein MRJ96_02635 [Nitrospirales bacterium]|nr:hypothetical protein [Nitrospira sp.]MDR4500338.1 hypothetical protein [Nitrospirales bacterium]